MNREHGHQLSESERQVIEVGRAQEVWQEAFDRLPSEEIGELAGFTGNPQLSEESIRTYITENESRLSPEGKFFLEMTINLRRAKDWPSISKH